MGNSLLRKKELQIYTGLGSCPEGACKDLEQIIILTDVYKSVIITLGPEDLTHLIASPRSGAVNRLCLAALDGKQYDVRITKENKTTKGDKIDNTMIYKATLRL